MKKFNLNNNHVKTLGAKSNKKNYKYNLKLDRMLIN